LWDIASQLCVDTASAVDSQVFNVSCDQNTGASIFRLHVLSKPHACLPHSVHQRVSWGAQPITRTTPKMNALLLVNLVPMAAPEDSAAEMHVHVIFARQ